MSQWAWWVGIDLGSGKHEACILDGKGDVRRRFSFDHTPQGLARFVAVLGEEVGYRYESVAVAMENNQGMVCDALLERGAAVHSINPKQLDRFRDRYNVAGAKDDRLDALVLADSLRTDTRLYRRVEPLPEESLRLRELSRELEELDKLFQQQANRLWSLLSRYFPVLLRFCPGADEPWLWELLKQAGTPKKAAALTEKRLGNILKPFRIRRFSPAELLAALKAKGEGGDPLTAEVCEEHSRAILKHLALVHRQIADQQKKICRILRPGGPKARPTVPGGMKEAEESTRETGGTDESPSPPDDVPTDTADGPPVTDKEIVLSIPGIGWKTGAAILGEAAQALAQRDYRALRGEAGTAPVTKRSGKTSYTVMRRACNYRLRRALHYAAGVAILHVGRWREIYHRIRSRGGSHARALRQIGDKMLKVLVVMLRNRSLFDITRFDGNSLNVEKQSGTSRQFSA